MYLKETSCLLIACSLSYVQCPKGKWNFPCSDIHSNQDSKKFAKFTCRKGIHIGKVPRESKEKANFITWHRFDILSTFLFLISSLFYWQLKIFVFWVQWNNNLFSIGEVSILWNRYQCLNREFKVTNQPLEVEVDSLDQNLFLFHSALEGKLVLPLYFLCLLGK